MFEHLAAAGLLLVATSLPAATAMQDPAAATPPAPQPGRLRLLWENDSWLSSRDRYYTNGAAIGWTLPAGPTAAALAAWLADLPFQPEHPTGTATGFQLGQEIFTPENTAASDLQVDDRPYAGWLHLDVRHEVLALGTERSHDTLDTWLLQVGIVGPSSLADDTQLQIHEAVGAPRPQGWHNQLHDEPGLVLGFRRDLRTAFDPRWPFGLASDFEGHYGARLGNVDTSAAIGAQVRLGWNLPRHFGSAIAGDDGSGRQRLYVAAGVDARVVLRDIFLDGNTFRSSHHIGHNHLVADFQVGLHWEPRPWLRLGITSVFETPEFDAPSHRDVSNYTSVEVEVFF